MDAFSNAISKILWEIPEEIIEDAVRDMRSRERKQPASLEELIRTKIIKDRVMHDINNLGGITLEINLSGVPYDKLHTYERIYEIPLKLTGGRAINKVNKVVMNVTSNYAERIPNQSSRSFQVSPIERSVQSVIASYSPIPVISNANIEILSDNVVKVQDFQNFTQDISLECVIPYTADFHELPPEYYPDFEEVCILAAKAFCYTRLALKLDMTRLEGGREFGRYKEFVEEWRDSMESYRTLINEKWYKIAVLIDRHTRRKHFLNAGKIKV